MTRPDWDTVWMSIAYNIGRRSRCDGRQIGAAIVSTDNSYVVVGYNGPPGGFPVEDGTTCQSWCPRRQNDDLTPGGGDPMRLYIAGPMTGDARLIVAAVNALPDLFDQLEVAPA